MTGDAKSRGPRPDFCYDRVIDIEPAWLLDRGISGLLLDIDNTLTRWERNNVPDDELAWLKHIEAAGIKCRLISNGLGHKRAKVVRQTGIQQVRGLAVKPLPAAFRLGLNSMELPAAKVMMIGDIIMTDIWPANYLGVWTCLVNPLSPIDFFGTKTWRVLERVWHWRKPLLAENDYRGKPAQRG